jgi:hypothetical protein
MYEVLKSIQASVAEIKATLADHSRLFLRIREDINNLRSDDLYQSSDALTYLSIPTSAAL